jgi:hypothetical protein
MFVGLIGAKNTLENAKVIDHVVSDVSGLVFTTCCRGNDGTGSGICSGMN